MNLLRNLAAIFAFTSAALIHSANGASDDGIRWLVEYDGKALPAAPAWTAHGRPEARVEDGALRLADSSKEEGGFFRAGWKAEADSEIVVEATVRVGETTGVVNKPGSRTLWPWKDGAPVSPVSYTHLTLPTKRIV